ncbi:restriction endonuclease [Dyella psychrodurans]|uniref:Restriction endonuclease n=1 Tax=Dyella psychrodurans TaxID=1927960 RepID=A0A370WWF0_9GAMM|nr:restriction endonuclease [Dyella psychrodurans]RDS80347.1 restriction endonuclease [Dyella psychrodurans]
MAKHGTRRIERFMSVHWPAGILLGMSAYFGVHDGVGAQSSVHIVIAWLLIAACWFGAFMSCLGYRRRMRRLVVRDEVNELRGIHWRDFERQVAQAFRYRGYVVEHAGHADIDNGLDLIVHKHGLTTLVQCRHWHNRNVDVKDVREMHGLMKFHQASAVKIVACGDYTEDAWKFVAGKPFELIYGETLLAMLSDAQLPIDASVVPFRAPASPPPMHHRPKTAAHP